MSFPNTTSIDAVLFDLDGTLLDTAPDIMHAINQVLKSENIAPASIDQVRPQVSHGAFRLIENILGPDVDLQHKEHLRSCFLQAYQQNLVQDTQLYSGISELLALLDTCSIPWGIVTNKSERFTLPLLEPFNLIPKNGCIVCGDTTPYLKPNPAPLLEAVKILGIPSEKIIYVGDAQKDMLAAKRAKITGVLAQYGYLDEQTDVDNWLHKFSITHPDDLFQHIQKQSGYSCQ